MNIRKGESNIRTVSEHRARLAMQVLDEFQNTWPIAIWTRHLLDCLLKIPEEVQPLSMNERLETQLIPSTRENPRVSHEYGEQAFSNIPNLGLSPPQSTSNDNNFSYEGLDSSIFSGHPVLFPFTNLFEDVGLSPGLYNDSERF